MFKNEKLQIAIVAVTTAFAGQIKVTPFNDEIFRIGLGTSNFLLFLLLMHQLPYIQTGIYTGVIVVAFRVYQEWLSGNGSFSLATSLLTHLPAFLFYVLFAIGMSRVQKRVNVYYPLILGAVISAIDLVANVSELLFRRFLLGHVNIQINGLFVLLIVAVVRSYFIVGLFSSISINQMRSLHAEQRKRMDQTLHIGSGLYGEIFYLKKSIDTIEHIAAKSYDLYCNLKEENQKEFSLQALRCAQEIHEVKKDSQRILAGLLKLFDKDIVAEMNLSEILRFVIHSNQKYSEMLKK
jgi:two-component system sensor histidine kinase YcbA